MTRTTLCARPRGPDVGVEALAHEAGLHPEVVRRLVALGFLDGGAPFPRDAAQRLARAARLRHDLGLNYAGALLACTLLDRIERLERRLRTLESTDARGGDGTWTRAG